MVTLGELLQAQDDQDLNVNLKRAFFADEPVAVDGFESEALTVLVNLTYSSHEEADLLDVTMAQALFLNDGWYEDLLKTAPWVVTHYLKDPNSRAAGCIRWIPKYYGADGQKYLGWSHNSNMVSKSHLLATEFFWENKVTSLFEQFSQKKDSYLIKALVSLGFAGNKVSLLRDACRNGMNNILPDFVSPSSIVLLFPDQQGEYLAVTPVVSANFQRWIHNLVKNPDISCRPIFYVWPFQVSSFLGTCGGKYYCLYYPPWLGRKDYKLTHLLAQWQHKKHLLNERSIFHKGNVKFLLQLVTASSVVESEAQQKERLKQQADRMEQWVEDVFDHLLLLRSQYAVHKAKISKALQGTVELEFIQRDVEDVEEVAAHFLTQLNEILEWSQYSAQLSYNPLLLPLFNRALVGFVKKSIEPDRATDFSGHFLHFKRLLAYDANARSNPYVLGLPAMTAWAGLVHAFLCNFGFGSDRVDFRFAVVLRKFAMNKGHPLAAQEIKNRKLSNAPVIDYRSCDLVFDLIIQLPPSNETLDFSQRNLFGCLPMQFAGGMLTSPIEGTFGQCSLLQQCDVYENQAALLSSIAQLPSYARVIRGVRNNPGKNQLINHLSKGTAFPVGSGFHFLGLPRQRRGIDDYLHTVSEPVLSLAKLRSVHAADPLENSLWSLTLNDTGVEVSVKEIADDETV
ncbi:type I-F CRISPR-associated protein Csy2 [Endozoicomonadaceae bacterium StTr2]